MNLHHLRAFRAVAHSGSFSHAASQLGISQPAVSMAVKKLEEGLGLSLVEQVGKQMQLTAAGEILRGYADRIATLEAQAEAELLGLKGLQAGRLHLGASTNPGAYILPPVIGRFKRLYPGVSVTLDIGNTRSIERRVALGELDCGVVGEERAGDPDLIASPLIEDELVVVAPAEHALAGQGVVSLERLLAEPFIVRERGSNTRQVFESQVHSSGHTVRVAMELGSTEAVREAVSAGLGLAVVSALAVRHDLAHGRLRRVHVEGLQLRRRFLLVQHRSRHLSPAAKAFVALLQER